MDQRDCNEINKEYLHQEFIQYQQIGFQKAVHLFLIIAEKVKKMSKNKSIQEDYSDPERIQCSLEEYDEKRDKYDLDAIIYKLDSQIDMLSCHADNVDYIAAIASGLLCSMLDILWCGDIDLSKAHEIGNDQAESLVSWTAKLLGCRGTDDISASVRFLEEKFPVPNDGNTKDFGGGSWHHLKDFGHHPTIAGLVFSLMTQFTGLSYGVDKDGKFCAVKVPENSQEFIGKSIPEKIVNGTITWFFHLISDIAGSNSTAGKSGGTGIPGPILATAEELSVLPFFRNICISEESLSDFLKKLFNGTLLAQSNDNGKPVKGTEIKFDLRTELGTGEKLASQALPVAANECIVRSFYFIRRFGAQIRENEISALADLRLIDWDEVKPSKNPTVTRMITVASAVFMTVDVGEAVITQKYWLSVNYSGVGRFAIAVSEDVSCGLKVRDTKKIREMYERIDRNTFRKPDNDIYRRIGKDMSEISDSFGLTIEQTEILFNIEYQKTLHDIEITRGAKENSDSVMLKKKWINEWRHYMTEGFSSFVDENDAVLHWYSKARLLERISECEPTAPWYRLTLLEAMLFEPYYPLETEKDKDGKSVPSKKYNRLQNPLNGYKAKDGDQFLDTVFTGDFCELGYVRRLRKSYEKCERELNEVTKTALKSLTISAAIAVAAVATAGALAPSIAVALVGSNFAGLSGAALTSACLAYLGGGAIAAGGAGMAGGTIAIVGGGAALGIGVGGSVGAAVGAVDIADKKNTILQSAKLLVSVKEIFLNDEKDLELSNTVYEQYLDNIKEIEKGLIDLQLQADVSSGKKKKELEAQISQAEKTVDAMKIARKSMIKYQTSFQEGMDHQS